MWRENCTPFVGMRGRRARARVSMRVVALIVALVTCGAVAGARGAVVRATGDAKDGSRVAATLTQSHRGSATVVRVDVLAGALASGDSDTPVYVSVHALASEDGDGACSGDVIGAVYNPRAATRGDACGSSDHGCAIGDVGARAGMHMIAGNAMKTYAFVDVDLPLHGEQSVVGRTLAVWRGDSWRDARFVNGRTPLVCATLVRDGEQNVIVARATVGTALSKVSGVVTFTQAAGDAEAETTVRVQLVNRAQGESSTGHEWGIYSMPAGTLGSCSRVGEAYNPQNKASCAHGSNKLASDCPLGELSKRQGAMSAPLLAMFTDGNLPLSGAHSIIGKSLVLFAKDGGTDKMLCSDIKLASTSKSQGGGGGANNSVHVGISVGAITALLVLSLCALRYYSVLITRSTSFFDWIKLNRSHMTFQRMTEEFREIPLTSPPRSPNRATPAFTIADESGDNGGLNHESVKRRGHLRS